MAPTCVLVVEDDDLVRSLAVESLRDEGFEVIEASNGDIAAKHLEDQVGFHVLLTDVRMPGKLDGIDLAAHARTRDPGLRVVIVSGYANQLGKRLQVFDPPVKFLRKPYRPAEVVKAIRSLFS